ncbi:MAG: alpha/beta fold hydrolase [Pseudolabrys sp.]|nr:alpha/beta fold hydrolase [Pseudolabrys sp.]
MPPSTPLILVPGLLCSARLYAPQIAGLWPHGPVMVADHRRDTSIEAIAKRILDNAPPRFALAGLSMGGYIAMNVVRQAPDRVTRLALLDTTARPETPEQTEGRNKLIALTQAGKLSEVVNILAPRFLNPAHQKDASLVQVVKEMAADTGPDVFIKQQRAIMGRPDSRPLLKDIRCPTLVLVGDGGVLTPPELSQEIAAGIPGARLVTVTNCGHLSTIEQPAAVNATMSEWLDA